MIKSKTYKKKYVAVCSSMQCNKKSTTYNYIQVCSDYIHLTNWFIVCLSGVCSVCSKLRRFIVIQNKIANVL